MTLLELIENYGPAVFADSETGVVIQRNGAYLNWATEGRDGWNHRECRAVSRDAYKITLAQAMDSAEAWFKEEMAGIETDDDEDGDADEG